MSSRASKRFLRNRGAVVGACLAVVVVLAALFAPLLAPHDPLRSYYETGLTALGAPVAPSGAFPLGTDRLGRDVLSRLLYGARISLAVGLLGNAVTLLLGLVIGLVSGYFGGRVDAFFMRLADLILSFPFLLLVITLVSILDNQGLMNVVVVLAIVGWTTMARVIRGKVLGLAGLPFVEAARAQGMTHAYILWRHILPNVMGPVIVLATVGIAGVILTESALSFLGLSVPLPHPTWGGMISEGQPYFRTAPWLMFAPGLGILLTVLGFNLLGDGLRDALDPRGTEP